jgi:multiple sugar transport system permease protein
MQAALMGHMGLRNRERLINAFSYGLLILAIVIIFLPLAWMLTVSVRPNLEVMKMPPDWIPQVFTLEGYVKIFSNPRYLVVFLNTTVVSLTVTAISLFLGAMAAYALARFRFAGQRTVLMFLITTQMFPLVLLCIPYFRIFITLGLYDTRTSLVIVYLTFTLPFCILMLRSYFMNIPRDIEEAAMVDGDSRLSALWRVVVPLAAPGLIATAIFTVIATYNDFILALTMTSTPDAQTIPVGVSTLIGKIEIQWGPMAAAGVVGALPIVIFALLVQRNFVRGLTFGAVK